MVALSFMCLIIKIIHLKYCPVCKMAVLSKIKSHSDEADYFRKLSFYNKSIKKPKVERLKNIDRLVELPFYEQLSVIKTDQAFTGYAMSYKVEISKKKKKMKSYNLKQEN